MISTSNNKFDPFITDVRKGLRTQEPKIIIPPWKVVEVDRAYGGDWFNIADVDEDGKEKIIIGADHLMLDGCGNIIAEFEIPDGLEPWIVGRGDCTGTGVQDAIYSVYTKSEDRESRQQWIYIFTNTDIPSEKQVKPEGTGVNFTFY